MRRSILIILAVILVIIIGGLGLMFYFMGQPMYQPGKLSETNITIAEQEPESDFWQMEEGIQLYHFSNGKGEPLLLIHGGPGMPYKDTLPGFNRLADQFTIHYYDQRGAGRSTKPFDRFESGNFYENMVKLEAKLGIGAQLKDIERIRNILGEEQLTLVGHSFGGYLASLYAAEFPDHVKKLVLISPAEILKFHQKAEACTRSLSGNCLKKRKQNTKLIWKNSLILEVYLKNQRKSLPIYKLSLGSFLK